MVSILRLQRNHDKKPLIKNSPLRDYVATFTTQISNDENSINKRAKLRAIWLLFHYALIKAENIFFQFGGLKQENLHIQSINMFTTTFTTRWSRVERYYLFHQATAALENPLFHLPPRLKAPILLLSRLSNQYPYHKLMI